MVQKTTIDSLLMCACVVAVVSTTSAFQSPSSSQNNVGLKRADFHALPKHCLFEEDSQQSALQRRNFLQQVSVVTSSLFLGLTLPSPANAETTAETQQSGEYVSLPNQKFSYTVTPPPSFTASNKPLKTHLDEINFSPPDVRGYTLGITVDPVRIKSIREFGTPEEVAARVVTAEVNRDGVFQVTLAKDPVEDAAAGGCYDIEYISEGKRGIKRFVTRIYIKDGFLYVLTVQSKEDEYDKEREKEVVACVKSFRPL